MLILSLSDTHRSHTQFTEIIKSVRPELIVFSGDGDLYSEKTAHTFLKWLQLVSESCEFGVVFTGGNHDKYLEEYWTDLKKDYETSKLKFLWNESCLLSNGLKIWGSPCSLTHGKDHNAFSGVDSELKKVWDLIPINLDLLFTHSPAKGFVDSGFGSETLRDRINEVKPRIHISGHIHQARGFIEKDGVTYVNSAVSEFCELFEPTFIEYSEKLREVIDVSVIGKMD